MRWARGSEYSTAPVTVAASARAMEAHSVTARAARMAAASALRWARASAFLTVRVMVDSSAKATVVPWESESARSSVIWKEGRWARALVQPKALVSAMMSERRSAAASAMRWARSSAFLTVQVMVDSSAKAMETHSVTARAAR